MAKSLADTASIISKWKNNTAGATAAYKAGVMRVTTAPGALAAAQKDKYVQGVIANADKWANNVAAVTLQQWQTQCTTKGATNLATGVQNADDKMTKFWNRFRGPLQQAMQQVNAMPSTTYEQRKAKSTAMMDALHQFSNKM